MSTLRLTDRNNELIKHVPKKYTAIILNNIIAKSVDSGLFLKEAAYVLDSETMQKLNELYGNPVKKIRTGRQIIKERIENLEPFKDDETGFVGFN